MQAACFPTETTALFASGLPPPPLASRPRQLPGPYPEACGTTGSAGVTRGALNTAPRPGAREGGEPGRSRGRRPLGSRAASRAGGAGSPSWAGTRRADSGALESTTRSDSTVAPRLCRHSTRLFSPSTGNKFVGCSSDKRRGGAKIIESRCPTDRRLLIE